MVTIETCFIMERGESRSETIAMESSVCMMQYRKRNTVDAQELYTQSPDKEEASPTNVMSSQSVIENAVTSPSTHLYDSCIRSISLEKLMTARHGTQLDHSRTCLKLSIPDPDACCRGK